MSSRTKTLTKMSIMFMMFAIVFSFRNIVNNQVQFGLFSIVLFLIGGIFYAIPLALVSSEFGSIRKLQNAEAGIGSFCTQAFGQKGGFLASWGSFFANVFFFATIAPFTIISLSYVFVGGNGFDNLAENFYENGMSADMSTMTSAVLLAVCAIVIFWIATLIARRGPKWIGTVTNIGGTSSLILGLVAIVASLTITLPLINDGKVQFDFSTLNPKKAIDSQFAGDWWAFMSVVPWVIFAYNGIETISVFIKDTKSGIKSFKFAAVLGSVLIIVLMVFGGLSIAIAISNSEFVDWGISNSYYQLFPALFGLSEGSIGFEIVIRLVSIIWVINGFGALLFWSVAPAKVFFAEIPEQAMGKWVAQKNEQGIPKNALIVQGIIATILLLVVGFTTFASFGENGEYIASGTSDFLTMITQATTTLSIFPILIMFIGYLKMRFKHDEWERDLRFVKNKWVALLWIMPTIILLIASMFFGMIPSPHTWETDSATAVVNLLLSFSGFIIFMGFAYFMWWFNMESGKVKIKNTFSKVKSKCCK